MAIIQFPDPRTASPEGIVAIGGDLHPDSVLAAYRQGIFPWPVEKLPLASWQTALGLGFVSAVFDNIPLTALALKQGGYDWGFLAYAVGFGGSMIWFGSSAGVALSNMYPEAKSVGLWLRHGWHVALAYVIGFAALLFTLGWQPNEPHKFRPAAPAPAIVNPAR